MTAQSSSTYCPFRIGQFGDMDVRSSTAFPGEPPEGLDARFCEVMDAAPVMIWVSGQDKRCNWFNQPWLSFTGREDDARAGKRLDGGRLSG